MKVILMPTMAKLLCFFLWYDLWSLLLCRGKARTPTVTDLGDTRIDMLQEASGKGRTAATDLKRIYATWPTNRSATWPWAAGKGGHHQ